MQTLNPLRLATLRAQEAYAPARPEPAFSARDNDTFGQAVRESLQVSKGHSIASGREGKATLEPPHYPARQGENAGGRETRAEDLIHTGDIAAGGFRIDLIA